MCIFHFLSSPSVRKSSLMLVNDNVSFRNCETGHIGKLPPIIEGDTRGSKVISLIKDLFADMEKGG